jgi:hypothetical protein
MPAQPVQVKEEKPAPLVPPRQELPKGETPPVVTAQNQQATVPVSQPSSPAPPQPSSKAIKPETPQPVAQAKSSSIAPTVPLDIAARYPYSIYLGSYQTQEMAKKYSSHKKDFSLLVEGETRRQNPGTAFTPIILEQADARLLYRKQLKDAKSN